MENHRLMIQEGWFVDQLETTDDADKAFEIVSDEVIELEAEMLEIAGKKKTPQQAKDYADVRADLKRCKMILNSINIKKSKMKRETKSFIQEKKDRILLDIIKEKHHDIFFECVEEMKVRFEKNND